MQKTILTLALFALSQTMGYAQDAKPKAPFFPSETQKNAAGRPAGWPDGWDQPKADPKRPTPKPNGATFIERGDVEDVLKAIPQGDHCLKSVDIGKENLSVGVVAYGQRKKNADGSTNVIVHHGQTETYLIVSGSGFLVTGGTVYDGVELTNDSAAKTTYNGPSLNGRVKAGDGSIREVKPGDVVIIPPDVPHGWLEVPEHIEYMTVRPDPERFLPAGYVNPHIKK